MIRLLSYYWKAKTLYRVHSPFAYEAAKVLLSDKRNFYAFGMAERFRELYKQSSESIEVTDFGAGSQSGLRKHRKVSDIASKSGSSRRKGKLLFRLVNWLKPSTMLELGTSLGLGTIYLASAAPSGRLITLEGCPNTARIALSTFQKLKMNKIDMCIGEFGTTLAQAINDLTKIDFAFLDGNHTKSATLDYYQQLKPFLHEKSVLVFDDIHWSDGMEEAWTAIIADPDIRLSIDLFEIGIVFFRKELNQAQHLTLCETRWKPWEILLSW